MSAITEKADRLPSEVKILLARIQFLKDNCQHRFEHTGHTPKLSATADPDIFKGSNREGYATRFKLSCEDCTFSKVANISESCFKCFGPMKADAFPLSTDEERRIFGSQNFGYQARLYRCQTCNFVAALYERSGINRASFP